jgi:hypothetical protein
MRRIAVDAPVAPLRGRVGFWSFGRLAEGAEDVHVAVMVPDTPRGPGRRGAGVGPHGRRAAGSPGRPGPKGLEARWRIATGTPLVRWT